jgi:hypothetical protein
MRQSISPAKSPNGLEPLASEPTGCVPGISGPSILPLRLVGVCYQMEGQELLHDLSFTIQAGGASVRPQRRGQDSAA